MAGKFNSVLTKVNFRHAYSHLTDVLASDPFKNMEGLNGDIPFHLCPFEPALQTSTNSFWVYRFYIAASDIKRTTIEYNLLDGYSGK